MCCESCPKYERCEENNRLKDDCCPKCPEYYDCVGADNREKRSFRDSNHDDSDGGYY